MENGANLLLLKNVSLINLDDVVSWLYALEYPVEEYKHLCMQVLCDEMVMFSNIKHRITMRIER